jgi:23S rRNA G2069 N7-methylase RlmK/C1962 C5-methylase RlmI
VGEAKELEQRDYFKNRLVKRDKHLRKWAKRHDSDCYRVYDRDIPEVPLAVDRYADAAILYHYERPYEKDPLAEDAWLALMREAAAEALAIQPDLIFIKTRRKLGLEEQYEKEGQRNVSRVVREQGLKFLVNLSDYLDSGLFMDHRSSRALVRAQAMGKKVLNLYAYTGSFSVYGLAGGARELCAVDLSNNYIAWADDNIRLNGLPEERYRAVRADAQVFLREECAKGSRYDIIVLDPPTFSNSKKMEGFLDVNRHWPELVRDCLAVLSPDGFILFSSNSRKLAFDADLLPGSAVRDISAFSVPQDFRPKQHRAWLISASAALLSSIKLPS